jgi:hypothetical protein
MTPVPIRCLAVFGLGVIACDAGLCANTVKRRVTAPDGRRDAILFIRDCGATTDLSPQVSILGAGKALRNVAGNVFIAPHSVEVQLEWVSPDTLMVRYANTSPNLRATNVQGVTIRYGSLP